MDVTGIDAWFKHIAFMSFHEGQPCLTCRDLYKSEVATF